MKSNIKIVLTIGIIYAISLALVTAALYAVYVLFGATIAYTIVSVYLVYKFLGFVRGSMVEALDEFDV
jgi:membrane protein implicated in regulation of membrane protease activity